MAVAEKTQTKPADVMSALADIDEAADRIAEEVEKLAAEQSALGVKQPVYRTALVPGLKDQIKEARSRALRLGVEPDLAKLQGQLDAAHERAAEVEELLSAARAAQVAVGHERRALLVERHLEFTAIVEVEVKRGEALLAKAAAACLDVGDQRGVILAALKLMFEGHPGNLPSKTHEDEQIRKAHYRSYDPWSQTNSPASTALFGALDVITRPRAGA